MDVLRKWLATLCFGLAGLMAVAAPVVAQGMGYVTLEEPQPTDTGNRIEVIEFFGYFCSHCHSFDPALKQWMRKQGANIVFKRAHVGSAAIAPQQKLFYTLSAMGRLEELHAKIFDAIHVQRLPLRRDEQVFDFIEKHGVDRARFIEIYNSAAIESLTHAAAQLQALFKVDGVPMLAVDGRYLTSPAAVAGSSLRQNMSEAELQAATLQVMDELVSRARKERAAKSIVRK